MNFFFSFKFCPVVVVASLLLHTFFCRKIYFIFFSVNFWPNKKKHETIRKHRRESERKKNIHTALWFIWKCGIFSFVSRFYITWKLWPLSLHIMFAHTAATAAVVRNTRAKQRQQQHSNVNRYMYEVAWVRVCVCVSVNDTPHSRSSHREHVCVSVYVCTGKFLLTQTHSSGMLHGASRASANGFCVYLLHIYLLPLLLLPLLPLPLPS